MGRKTKAGRKPIPKRILVIDDDEAVRDSIATILIAAGYDVATADDGRKGYESCLEDRPDLIITNILMPGQEGIETIIQIRKSCPGIRIIAMSGGGRTKSGSFLELAKRLGADRSLEKPFEFDVLIDAIEGCLG